VRPEQILEAVHVQNADACISYTVCASRRFISIDIKNTYFHIHIYPPHRKRIGAFKACLVLFHRGGLLKFRLCLRLLELMASALVVIPFGW